MQSICALYIEEDVFVCYFQQIKGCETPISGHCSFIVGDTVVMAWSDKCIENASFFVVTYWKLQVQEKSEASEMLNGYGLCFLVYYTLLKTKSPVFCSMHYIVYL